MIDAGQQYEVVYTPLAFATNTPFLKRVKTLYPAVEIPFVDLPNLSQDAREAFDTYLYFPAGHDVGTAVAKLNRTFPAVGFHSLGALDGKSILAMLSSCERAVEAASSGHAFYKVRTGPRRNLTVQVSARTGDKAEIVFYLFGKARTAVERTSNLAPTEPPTDPYKRFTNLLATAPVKRAVVIDGNAELGDAMFAYNRKRVSATGRFIGGALGFYFTLLRFREFLADYEMHVVFDGYGPSQLDAQISDRPAFRAAYRDNQNWIERFVHAAGFNLYRLPGKRAGDVVASLSHTMTSHLGYRNVLVYSKDPTYYQCVTEAVKLSLPKSTSRDHPRTHGLEETINQFGLRDVSRLNWLRAISGDGSDEVRSVNTVNKDEGHPYTNLTRADYLEHIYEAPSLAALKATLGAMEPFRPFVMGGQFERNIAALSLDRTLFDGHHTLAPFAGQFDGDVLEGLMTEYSFYKELEHFPRIHRILKGIW